jgi:hypothetical protein
MLDLLHKNFKVWYFAKSGILNVWSRIWIYTILEMLDPDLYVMNTDPQPYFKVSIYFLIQPRYSTYLIDLKRLPVYHSSIRNLAFCSINLQIFHNFGLRSYGTVVIFFPSHPRFTRLNSALGLLMILRVAVLVPVQRKARNWERTYLVTVL